MLLGHRLFFIHYYLGAVGEMINFDGCMVVVVEDKNEQNKCLCSRCCWLI